MLGIIFKDYLTCLIPKNTFAIILNLVTALLVMIFMPEFYGMCLIVPFYLPLSASCLVQVAMEQDELVHFDKLQLTFPLTKRKIVLSKFVGSLIFLGMTQILNFFAMLYFYNKGVADFTICLQLWVLGFAVGFILQAISNLGFYLLGNKKGSIMYLLMLGISVVIYLITYYQINVMRIFEMNHNLLIAILIFISLLMLYSSYRLCVLIYSKRFS